MKAIELRDPEAVRTVRETAKAEGRTATEALERLVRNALGLDDLTVRDVCRQLRIHRNTFYNLNAQGAFPNAYYRNSRVLRIPQSDVEKYRRGGVVKLSKAA